MLAERAAMSEEGREETRLNAEADAEAAQQRIDGLLAELAVAQRLAKQAQQEAVAAATKALAAGKAAQRHQRTAAAPHRRGSASGAGAGGMDVGSTSPTTAVAAVSAAEAAGGPSAELAEVQARASALEQELHATKVRNGFQTVTG